MAAIEQFNPTFGEYVDLAMPVPEFYNYDLNLIQQKVYSDISAGINREKAFNIMDVFQNTGQPMDEDKEDYQKIVNYYQNQFNGIRDAYKEGNYKDTDKLLSQTAMDFITNFTKGDAATMLAKNEKFNEWLQTNKPMIQSWGDISEAIVAKKKTDFLNSKNIDDININSKKNTVKRWNFGDKDFEESVLKPLKQQWYEQTKEIESQTETAIEYKEEKKERWIKFQSEAIEYMQTFSKGYFNASMDEWNSLYGTHFDAGNIATIENDEIKPVTETVNGKTIIHPMFYEMMGYIDILSQTSTENSKDLKIDYGAQKRIKENQEKANENFRATTVTNNQATQLYTINVSTNDGDLLSYRKIVLRNDTTNKNRPMKKAAVRALYPYSKGLDNFGENNYFTMEDFYKFIRPGDLSLIMSDPSKSISLKESDLFGSAKDFGNSVIEKRGTSKEPTWMTIQVPGLESTYITFKGYDEPTSRTMTRFIKNKDKNNRYYEICYNDGWSLFLYKNETYIHFNPNPNQIDPRSKEIGGRKLTGHHEASDAEAFLEGEIISLYNRNVNQLRKNYKKNNINSVKQVQEAHVSLTFPTSEQLGDSDKTRTSAFNTVSKGVYWESPVKNEGATTMKASEEGKHPTLHEVEQIMPGGRGYPFGVRNEDGKEYYFADKDEDKFYKMCNIFKQYFNPLSETFIMFDCPEALKLASLDYYYKIYNDESHPTGSYNMSFTKKELEENYNIFLPIADNDKITISAIIDKVGNENYTVKLYDSKTNKTEQIGDTKKTFTGAAVTLISLSNQKILNYNESDLNKNDFDGRIDRISKMYGLTDKTKLADKTYIYKRASSHDLFYLGLQDNKIYRKTHNVFDLDDTLITDFNMMAGTDLNIDEWWNLLDITEDANIKSGASGYGIEKINSVRNFDVAKDILADNTIMLFVENGQKKFAIIKVLGNGAPRVVTDEGEVTFEKFKKNHNATEVRLIYGNWFEMPTQKEIGNTMFYEGTSTYKSQHTRVNK